RTVDRSPEGGGGNVGRAVGQGRHRGDLFHASGLDPLHRGSRLFRKPARRGTSGQPDFHRHLDPQGNRKDPQARIRQFPGHYRYHHHHQGWHQMKSTLRISLKSGERIFINGAVLRVDRKVAIEFLNDVTFLLENHVLQPEQATTPLRQLYFIAQMSLINPEGAEQSTALFRKSVLMLLSCFRNEEVLAELKRVDGLVAQGRAFEALKAIRALYPIEERVLSNQELPPATIEQIRKEIAPW